MNLMSVQQFAQHCGCSRQAIEQHIRSGKLAPVTSQPTVIDADTYLDFVKLVKLRKKHLHETAKNQ